MTPKTSAPDESKGNGAPSRNPTTEANPLAATEEFGLSMEELVRNSESVEGLIAACMIDAGFEYVAVDFDTTRLGMTAEKSLPGMSEEEYVAQYGYGVTTLYTGQAPHLAGPTSPSRIGLGEQNVEIFNSLPLSRRWLVEELGWFQALIRQCGRLRWSRWKRSGTEPESNLGRPGFCWGHTL